MATEKLGSENEALFFPFSPILERSGLGEFYSASLNEVASKLSFELKIKVLAGL